MTTETPNAVQRSRHSLWWLCGAGIVVAGWGAFALWKAFAIEQPTAYRPMGPRVFPIIISSGLIVCGLAFVVQVLRGADHFLTNHVDQELRSSDPALVALVIGLLIAYATAFERVGYVVSTSLFLPAVSRVLGSRKLLRDLVVAVLLAVIAFTVFTRLLNIDLPAGVMGDVL